MIGLLKVICSVFTLTLPCTSTLYSFKWYDSISLIHINWIRINLTNIVSSLRNDSLQLAFFTCRRCRCYFFRFAIFLAIWYGCDERLYNYCIWAGFCCFSGKSEIRKETDISLKSSHREIDREIFHEIFSTFSSWRCWKDTTKNKSNKKINVKLPNRSQIF